MRGNCRTSSCLEPSTGDNSVTKGTWPAKSGKKARVFPLLQAAAIVEKVNTPHSLTGKSSSQEWKEIKSLFQPASESPQGCVCCWGSSGNTETSPNSGPHSTPTYRMCQPQDCSPVAVASCSFCLELSDEARQKRLGCSGPRFSTSILAFLITILILRPITIISLWNESQAVATKRPLPLQHFLPAHIKKS